LQGQISVGCGGGAESEGKKLVDFAAKRSVGGKYRKTRKRTVFEGKKRGHIEIIRKLNGRCLPMTLRRSQDAKGSVQFEPSAQACKKFEIDLSGGTWVGDEDLA